MSNLEALKQELLRTNANYQRLVEEHRECEERLALLVQKSLPSQEDEAEEKRLKIHKLSLKDQMENILRSRRENQVAV